jgi:acetylornithine deacetylase/succinyl-diaminopimelate desuccinylase-like protein
VARRLLAAGYPVKHVQVVGPNPGHLNVVARLRGSGARKPILLLAHLDVVEALRAGWSMDPFTLTEKDGYFDGRGTSDIKDMAAIFHHTAPPQARRVPARPDIPALASRGRSAARR